MAEKNINSQRLAKNTIILYCRTGVSLLVSLYTARVVLQVLGVENYGVLNAVGGIMGMGAIITGALSNSISRFITYELGRGDAKKLNHVFITSMNIQLVLAATMVLLCETIGVWFLNTQMNIPFDRMTAANWILQFVLLSVVFNLTQVPYGACIVGHERMSIFAWFSIVESVLRLLIVFLLYISPYDKLICYSALGTSVSFVICMAQRLYCRLQFPECHYKPLFNKKLMREMTGFAGWSCMVNTTWVLNSQGINILMNIFFGVVYNAARGVSSSIEGVIKSFYTDFMTAMSPQITKSYAAGDLEGMNKLICQGAKHAYFLLFFLSLPFMFETYMVLKIWLGIVPDYTVIFFRLGMISALVMLLGETGLKACMATGNIKWYSIIIGSISCFVFPLTWLAFQLGMRVEFAYIIHIFIYGIINIVRLFIMKSLWGFPIGMYISQTIVPVMKVTIVAIVIPLLLYHNLEDSVVKSVTVMGTCLISSMLAVYILGLSRQERDFIVNKIKLKLVK